MSKFCLSDRFTNRSGDALSGYIVRVLDKDSGAVVPIFSDENGTAIPNNEAIQDDLGNFTLFADYGIYSVECLEPNTRARIGFRRYVNMDGNDASLRDEITGPEGVEAVVGYGDTLGGSIDPFVEVSSSTYSTAIAADTSGSMFRPSHNAGFHWMRNRGGGLQTIWSGDHPTLNEACAVAARIGGVLKINRDHDFSAAITCNMTAGLPFWIETEGHRTLNYTGAMTFWALRFFSLGRNPFIMEGDLTVNGNRNCNIPLWIDMQNIGGTDRRDCRISGVHALGSTMKTGANAYSSTVLRISGGFDNLLVEDYELGDCWRDAGTGSLGTKGNYQLEIGTALGTTIGAKHIHVRNGTHRDLRLGDTPGTSAFSEGDALNCFQSLQAAESAPKFEDLRFINAAVGRAIKCFAPIGGAISKKIYIEQSEHTSGVAGTDQGPILIDHQASDGTVEDVTYRLSGNANAGGPLTLIGMGTSHDLPYRQINIKKIECLDTTGRDKLQLIGMQHGAFETKPRQVSISNFRDTGTARCISRLGTFGTYVRHQIDMDTIDVNLTQAAFQSDSAQNFLRVRGRSMVNSSGTVVPALTNYTAAQRVVDWGDFHHDGDCPGFARYVGTHRVNTTWTNGFRGSGGGVEATPADGKSEVRGRVEFKARAIAASATTRWPPTGQHNPSAGNYTGQINNVTYGGLGGFFNFAKAAGSTNFTTLTSGSTSGMALVNGGAGTGTGTNIEFYIDSTTNELICENRSAAEVVIQFTANP